MAEDYSYKTSNDETLSISTYGNDSLESKNCIIFVHGFKGFKDWGFGPYLAKYLSTKGFFVITFNFSHNGVSIPMDEFTELDKFAQNTYSLEITELNELINAYKEGFFGTVDSSNKLGLIGHSRGGGVSIVAASENSNVDALVTWSAIANFDRFSERQKKEWRNNGKHEIINARTKQVMNLNISLLDDIEKNAEGRLNINKALTSLHKPYLIIHGEQDLAVKFDEAEKIYEWSNKSSTRFESISKTGHTFDIKQPFEGTNDKFEKVLELTSGFFINSFKL
jgi:pimeloyl-ACP methyl ester carboxylesterase